MFKIIFNKSSRKYSFEKRVNNEKNAFSVHGNLEQVTESAINFGIDQEELLSAYVSMRENCHTEADFGINGKFIFSK